MPLSVEWHEYQHDQRGPVPAPDSKRGENDRLVWIYCVNGNGDMEVLSGQHIGWWETYWGSDDIRVTHWAEIDYPDPPGGGSPAGPSKPEPGPQVTLGAPA